MNTSELFIINTKMNTRIESSFNDIRSTVNHYEKYKETYKLLKTLPLYQKLKKKNNTLKNEIAKLKDDNKKLLDIICSIPSISLSTRPKSKKLRPLRDSVKAKKESDVRIVSENIIESGNDEVCVVDAPLSPNIIVNIIDDEESFLEIKKNVQCEDTMSETKSDELEEEETEEDAEEETEEVEASEEAEEDAEEDTEEVEA